MHTIIYHVVPTTTSAKFDNLSVTLVYLYVNNVTHLFLLRAVISFENLYNTVTQYHSVPPNTGLLSCFIVFFFQEKMSQIPRKKSDVRNGDDITSTGSFHDDQERVNNSSFSLRPAECCLR
jgi:hypothetical protein